MTRSVARLGSILVVVLALSVVVPVSPTMGAPTPCVRYPGTAGGTIRVGPVEVDVPPTTKDLVGICWYVTGPHGVPRLTDPDVAQYTGCGTPCFKASSNLYVPGRQVTLEVYTNGAAQSYGPFGFNDTNVPVCITFGDPEPPC